MVDAEEFGLIVEAYIDEGLGPDDIPWDTFESLADAWGVSVFEAYAADVGAYMLGDFDDNDVLDIFAEDGGGVYSDGTADDILDEFGEL